MVGADHSWDGLLRSRVRLERRGFQVALTKSAEEPTLFTSVGNETDRVEWA
jgi:hypothetical protein